MITPKGEIEKCPRCGQPVKAIDLRRLGIKCSKYDRWEIEHMNYEHGCGNTMHGMTKKELVNEWNRYARSVEEQRLKGREKE